MRIRLINQIYFKFSICFLLLLVACQYPLTKNSIQRNAEETVQLQRFDSLMNTLYLVNPDSSAYYCSQKIDYCLEIKYFEAVVESCLFLAELYQYRKLDNEKAISNMREAAQVLLSNPGLNLTNPYFYINLGNSLNRLNLNDEAILAYQEAFEQGKDVPYCKALAMNNIALIYQEKKSPEPALVYFRKAVHLIHDNNDILKSQSYSYINNLMLEQGKIDSIEYYHKLVAFSLAHVKLKKFYQNRADSLKDVTEISKISASSTYILAQYYEKSGAFQKADSCFRNVIDESSKTGNVVAKANACNHLAGLYKRQLHFHEAIVYADSALNCHMILKDFVKISEVSDLLNDLHFKSGSLSRSDHFKKLSQNYSDSLALKVSSNQFLNNKIFLASATIKLALKELSSRNKAVNQSNSLLRIIIWLMGTILFLVIGAGIMILYLRHKNLKVKERLARRTMEVVEFERDNLAATQPTEPKLIINTLSDQLDQLIRIDKIYLDPDLSLTNLALKLNTNTSYLSQVFNQQYKVNFHYYMNDFRIKEACRLLITNQDPNITIDHIATMCGFSGKSTFYNTFKKFTGVSPVNFKKFQQNGIEV